MANTISLETSSGFGRWLAGHNASLVVSGYQSGQVFIIGTSREGKAQLSAIRFDRAMGLNHGPRGLWMATLSQLIHFVPVRPPPGKRSEHDFIFVPQCSIHTGYIDAHEVAVDADGRPLVAASFFDSVLSVDAERGAAPVWAPPSVSHLVAADTCHVNGICLDKGRLRFVTALASGGEENGWRQHHDRGVVFDAVTGRTLATSLIRPHSPRLHEGRLWLLQSGNGTIGHVRSGQLLEMTLCPGYPRGLAFLGDAAVIGVSRLRDSGSGADLPLASRLRRERIQSRCGVVVLDTRSGRPFHEAYFGDGVDEIFDVVVLKGVKNPKLLKPGSAEAARSYLFRKGTPETGMRRPARITKDPKGRVSLT